MLSRARDSGVAGKPTRLPLSDRACDREVVRAPQVTALRFVNVTGVVSMNKIAYAVRSPIRNVVLCGLLTFGLAACGGGESGSSGGESIASDPVPSLV